MHQHEEAMSEFKDLKKIFEYKPRGVYRTKLDLSSLSDDPESEEGFLSKYVHWSTSDNEIFLPAAKNANILIPGAYEIKLSSNIGLFFQKIPVRSDDLIKFPDTNSDRVVQEIQKFWEREDVFKEYSLTYKRGILLYGPPGSGKSCAIQLIMNDVIEREGVVIKFTEPSLFIDGMRILRQIQPKTPVVVIMEDIDADLEIYKESSILNLLDGINEINKVVFLATTNYPDRLDDRVINRPSRFDKRFRIGFPSKSSRKIYLEHLIGQGDENKLKQKVEELNLDLKKWVKDTNGFSIAHLKELFIQVVIIGDTYEEAIKTLKDMKEIVKNKDEESSIGFTPEAGIDYYN